MPDHYATLGIQETATKTEIITVYRQLARIHHPDKNPEDTINATRRFQEVSTYIINSPSFGMLT